MVEMDYYARVSDISAEEFLDRCVAAGLESCPRGGSSTRSCGWRSSATARASPPTAPSAQAQAFLESLGADGVYVPPTVLAETVWVLQWLVPSL